MLDILYYFTLFLKTDVIDICVLFFFLRGNHCRESKQLGTGQVVAMGGVSGWLSKPISLTKHKQLLLHYITSSGKIIYDSSP